LKNRKLLVLTAVLVLFFSLALPSLVSSGTASDPLSKLGRNLNGDVTSAAVGSLAGASSAEFFLKDQLDVNIVFIGFSQARIDTNTIKAGLPSIYRPHIRAPLVFFPPGTNPEEFLGIEWTYNYNFVFKNEAFAQNLFSYMMSIGQMGAPTVYQQMYNERAYGPVKVQITENMRINAPAVEQYLLQNLGLSANSYTVVFINGYGTLPFHTYQFVGEPDPDTQVDFGYRDSRQMNAWGGTYGRLWYYDFSAGPIYWDDQYATKYYWNPQNYVIPCIWDYDTGSTSKLQLSYDVKDITRYVAVNLLFTTSPLYRPLLYENMHITLLNFQDNVWYYDQREGQYKYLIGSQIIVPPQFVTDVYEKGEPNKNWLTTFEERYLWDDPAVVNVLYNDYPYPLSVGAYELFWQNASYYTTPKHYDYTMPIMTFTMTDATAIETGNFGILGWADNDYSTGTQAITYALVYPYVWNLGYGLTSTFVHEAGHHVSLSHPHDGYDYEDNLDYEPDGRYYFVWVGDQVYSLMSYMSNVFNFGVFDKDNLWRDEAAIAMKEIRANLQLFNSATQKTLNKILASAEAAFQQMDYLTMNRLALQAYWSYVEPLISTNSLTQSNSASMPIAENIASKGTFTEPVRRSLQTTLTPSIATVAKKED
jgi:hypothetical protein